MNKVIKTDIIEELSQSFIDYGMSVITDRAIPSVEDGLKPSLRRVLWDMYNTGITHTKPYSKSAKVVGDTMGNWHPHGDSSIYGTLVGASQPWNMRYPLIDFHGNMGSRDGDGAASMRYTECRLNKLSEATLEGLKKRVVDFQPNYSETDEEPVYLPGLFPNLLCNGTTGIAVAMSCTFLPHNLNEVMSAIISTLDGEENPLQHIAGPDFPTGGLIINEKDLPSIYETGRGSVKVRGEYEINKNTIIFSSIPYKVSKENLLEDINNLCESKKLVNIKDVRDESNKKGVRFCIECEPNTTDKVVKDLFLYTKLQSSYSLNQVVLVKKKPQLLGTQAIIDLYLEHQKEVLRNQLTFDADKLESRLIILRGLLKALESIDNIISLIKRSKNTIEAKQALCTVYDFLEVQAEAIVNMKLGKLASLEGVKLQTECDEKTKEKSFIEFVLKNEEAFNKEIKTKLVTLKDTFSDERRTSFTNIDLTKAKAEKEAPPDKEVVIAFTNKNFFKHIIIKTQNRNGKGLKLNKEFNRAIFNTNVNSKILVFTTIGKMYQVAVADIPETEVGISVHEMLDLENGEQVKTVVPVNDSTHKGIMFLTKMGRIKFSSLEEYISVKRKKGIVALKLKEGDTVVDISLVSNEDLLLLYTNKHAALCPIEEVPMSGRVTLGVKGLNVKNNEALGMALLNSQTDTELVVVSAENTGKIISAVDVTTKHRGNVGSSVLPKEFNILSIIPVQEKSSLICESESKSITINVKDLPKQSEVAQGVSILKGITGKLKRANLIL